MLGVAAVTADVETTVPVTCGRREPHGASSAWPRVPASAPPGVRRQDQGCDDATARPLVRSEEIRLDTTPTEHGPTASVTRAPVAAVNHAVSARAALHAATSPALTLSSTPKSHRGRSPPPPPPL